jgi:hypothetical protein
MLNVSRCRNQPEDNPEPSISNSTCFSRIPSSGMLRRVAIVRTDVSEERIASDIRMTRICKVGRTLAVTSNRSWRVSELVFLHSVLRLLTTTNVVTSSQIFVALMMEAIRSSETSVLTRAKGRHIPEDDILHSHCRENLKSYISTCFLTTSTSCPPHSKFQLS